MGRQVMPTKQTFAILCGPSEVWRKIIDWGQASPYIEKRMAQAKLELTATSSSLCPPAHLQTLSPHLQLSFLDPTSFLGIFIPNICNVLKQRLKQRLIKSSTSSYLCYFVDLVWHWNSSE